MTQAPIRTGISERPDWPLAVVIGAGGMGMAVARRLGQRNRLLLVDVDAGRAEAEAERLRGEGHDAVAHVCDITDEGAVASLATRAGQIGPVRVLAHVAALSPSMGSAEQLLNINLRGAFMVERAFLEVAGPGTAAIFIASLAAHIGTFPDAVLAEADKALERNLPGRIEAAMGAPLASGDAYRLSKRAMLRLCRRRAAAWGAKGGRIVSLSPGLIATPMGALEFEQTPAKRALLPLSPVPREGTSLEIADAVEFLASDKASFISGIDLLVDGGLSAALDHKGE